MGVEGRLGNSMKLFNYLRPLKAMSCAPPGPFITSILELKLDESTSFEWQKFSQDLPDLPHYDKLLAFLKVTVYSLLMNYS
jgi:hypothetical protein